MSEVSQNKKITIDQLAGMVSKGFSSIEKRMVTKEDVKEIVQEEVIKIVEEKVEKSAARYFGLMKEWVIEQFQFFREEQASFRAEVNR